MPNWKKLVTSGSDASLNSITVETFVSASSFVGDGSGLTGVTSYTDTDTLAFVNSINALSGSALQNAIDTEKARIDAILLSADADKDSFTEIVSLINSIDTDNDTAFASFYTASNGRLGDLEAATSSLEAFTSSLENKTLLSSSAQISSDISGSFTATSSSIAADINELNTFSSSLSTTILDLTGSFTGDGTGLTGITSTVVEETTVFDSFTGATTKAVTHNFGTKNVIVTVYEGDNQIIPTSIATTTDNLVTVTFDKATTGRIVIVKGGHIVSGTVESDIDLSEVDQHIIPTTDNTYDLGSPTKQWRDLYLSSASLYIDGTKVISSNTDTLTFTTDVGQSIKLLETGGDDITLQTDTGNIELKGTVEIESGKKITDSAATMINFGDSIAVTGSILTTGTVDGIDLQAFSSSVAAGFANTTADYNELTNIPVGIISSSAQIASDISGSTNWTSVSSSILPSDTEVFDLGSTSKRWRDLYLSGSTIDLGGTKISRVSATGDIEFKDGAGNRKSLKVDELTIGTGATAKKLKVNNGKVQFTDSDDNVDGIDYTELSNIPAGIVSGSSQVDYSSIQNTPTTITTQQASDITANNSKVGYTDALVKTKLNTENVVSGSSQITTLLNGQDLTLNNLTVDGTQTIIDSTRLAIGDNIIELNAGGATNGGLLIKDVTAPNNVSGSLLWDSTNDYWIGGALGSESKLLRAIGDNIISGSSQVDYNSIQNKPTNVSSFTNDVGYLTSYTDTNTTYTAGTNLTLTGTEFSLNSSPTLTGLTSTGNVSITSNSNTLNLYNNANNDALRVFRGSLQTLGLWTATNGTILSLSSDTVAGSITLDSRANQDSYINTGGNLGLGTTTPGGKLDIQLDSTGELLSRLWNTNSSGTGKSVFRIANSGNNALGSQLQFTDATYYVGTISADRTNGMSFYTGLQGTPVSSERMRIDSSGNVVINGGALRNQTNLNSTGDAGLLIKSGDRFGFDESGVRSWNIKATGGNLAFNSGDGNGTYTFGSNLSVTGNVTATALTETSALRFKENIQEDIDSSIIDKLRPVSYDWKENKEKDYGFIAEEVSELDSTLTTENEDGEMLGIKYTKLIPFLVKKIQEQEERIKQLENGNS